MWRGIDDQQLRTSRPACGVQLHEQSQAGRVDEAQTRAFQLDIAVDADEA